MKPVMYNCEKCSEVLVLEPKRMTDNAGKEIYTLPAHCPECLKTEPLLELFVKIAPLEYNVSEALDENVRLGNMTRKWNAKRKDWEYKLTLKGKEEAEKLITSSRKGEPR